MNRARLSAFVPHLLISALLLTLGLCAVTAQNRSRTPQAGRRTAANSRAKSLGLIQRPPGYKPMTATDPIPAGSTRRDFDFNKAAKGRKGRAPGDTDVVRQVVLISFQIIGGIDNRAIPAASHSEHPVFSNDGTTLFFDSNRTSTTDTTPAANFNIYSALPDGGSPQLISPPGLMGNNVDPVPTRPTTTLAFVNGGTFDFTNSVDNPSSSGFQLYVQSLTDPTSAPIALTTQQNQYVFTDVRHPTWDPTGTQIAFAGQLGGKGQPYHIYQVQVVGGTPGFITQLTSGTSNDTAPAWSPDGTVIAFTTNASGFTTTYPIQATGLNPGNTTDIVTINPANSPAPAPVRMTNFILPGGRSSNKNACWTTVADKLGLINRTLLVFASTRIDATGTGVGNGLSPNGSYDIYYLDTTKGVESAANQARYLRTSASNNGTVGLNPGENTIDFDNSHVTNEDFPAVPPTLTSYRIVFQSDRVGPSTPGSILNLWGATIIDINAPTLLRYSNQEVVHISTGSLAGAPIREAQAGSTIYVAARVVDYESGVNSVYLQIKNPNSVTQAGSGGVEHKIWANDPFAYDSTTIQVWAPGLLDKNTLLTYPPFEEDCQAVNANDGNTSGTFRLTGEYLGPGNGPNFAPSGQLLSPLPNAWNYKGVVATGNRADKIRPQQSEDFYVAGKSDRFAFSGNTHPPDWQTTDPNDPLNPNKPVDKTNSYWLRLYDDGPISQGGHEPEGSVAGDGVFSNAWTTPAGLPSDWVMDVIVYDNAIDPYDTTQTSNWKIYDNIYGFTTLPFQLARSQVLYVNDYDSGQRSFATNFGPATGIRFTQGFFVAVPTESWMTEINPAYIGVGTSGIYPPYMDYLMLSTSGAKPGQVLNFLNTMGSPTPLSLYIADGATLTQYDQWRILCRGPVPPSVLTAYGPIARVQPPDIIGGAKTGFTNYDAKRCVVWHAPYTGDIFVGPGTIIDPDTQANITAFVKNGGRIMICGQDIAFALAGTQFLKDICGVSFYFDNAQTNIDGNTGNLINPVAGKGTHPIADDPRYDLTWLALFEGPETNDTHSPAQDAWHIGSLTLDGTSNDHYEFAAPNQAFSDLVDPTYTQNGNTDVPEMFGIDAHYGGGNANAPHNGALFWHVDQAGKRGKVAFSPFGWEGINPNYFTLPMMQGGGPSFGIMADAPILKFFNKRPEIMQNYFDWARTSSITGKIIGVNQQGVQTPLGGAFVRATRTAPPPGTGRVTVGTAITRSDGTYNMDGIDATGYVIVDAVRAGFQVGHSLQVQFFGGQTVSVDLALQRIEAGTISGKVTTPSGLGVANVQVVAINVLTKQSLSPAITNTDGTYVISDVPAQATGVAGDGYFVYVNTPANSIYQGSTPPQYGDLGTPAGTLGAPVAGEAPLVVVPPGGQGASNGSTAINFTLKLKPGSIGYDLDPNNKIVPNTGTVTNSQTGQPIPGAQVEATNGTVTPPIDIKVTADSQGNYLIPNLDPATYQVTASAPGFSSGGNPSSHTAPISVSVTTGQNTHQNLILDPVPPQKLYGLVSTSSAIPIGGATVVVTDASGAEIARTTTGAEQTTTVKDSTTGQNVSVTYNYVFPTIPAGATVNVYAFKTGYTPNPAPTQSKTIVTGFDAYGVNFILDPLFTFNSDLTLVSSPYQFPQSIVDLFSIPQADVNTTFAFVGWDAVSQRYIYYPVAPSTTLTLGKGYFLEETNTAVQLALTADVTTAQTAPLDPNTKGYAPYYLRLETGWNLIGNPFATSLDFLKLSVQARTGDTPSGPVVDVPTAQTQQNPLIGGAIYTYQHGAYNVAFTLDPYRGYWIKAIQPSYLIASVNAAVTRGQKPNARAIVVTNNTNDGWRLELMARAGDQKGVGAHGYLGASRAATDKYDIYKLPSPPPATKQYVTLTFDHSDWNEMSGSYMADIRSATATTWDFTVRSNVPNTPVTLTWPTLNTLPRSRTIELTDLDTQQKMNLRNIGNLVIPAAGNQALTRHYRLRITKALHQALQLNDLAVRLGSPSRAQGSASANISYSLTTDATVQVTISSGGRHVRTLETGRTRAAGAADAVWDMRNDSGSPVPAGLYTVEVRAVDKDGHLVTRVSTLPVTR